MTEGTVRETQLFNLAESGDETRTNGQRATPSLQRLTARNARPTVGSRFGTNV